MQVTTIFGHEFTTLQSLKDFAKIHGVIPSGNKSLKVTWVEAIETYMEVQSEVVAMAVDAEIEASQIATKVEETAVSIGSLVVAALTSEAAVLGYRVVLKTVAFALVMAWLVTVAAARWCWAHRSSTAVYHWVKDALASEFTLSAIIYLMLGQWVVNEWIDSIRSVVVSTVADCRAWVNGLVEDARSVVG
jgi:hypothetical protein